MDCGGLSGWHDGMSRRCVLRGDEDGARFHRLAARMVLFLKDNERKALAASAEVGVKRGALVLLEDLAKKLLGELRDFKQMVFVADDGERVVYDATSEEWGAISNAVELCSKLNASDSELNVATFSGALSVVCSEWMSMTARSRAKKKPSSDATKSAGTDTTSTEGSAEVNRSAKSKGQAK